MKTYEVGGAVRDRLMGFDPRDRDYVVVGATPEDMLGQGFTRVGADFPVFLHPQTGEEYALARPARGPRTQASNYVPDRSVTLEEDLSRRDLTINAMAMDADGQVIDPFDGQLDLQYCTLRHVSPAFREDPLRVLRVARFLARFGQQWQVADTTMVLMADMVRAGELDQLPGERVWKELSRGLMEPHPHLMIALLQQLEVFSRPGFEDYAEIHPGYRVVLSNALREGASLAVRFGATFIRSWDKVAAKKSCVPSDVRDIAQMVHFGHSGGLIRFAFWTPAEQLAYLERMDAFRQPERLLQALEAFKYATGSSMVAVKAALSTASQVDVKAITASMPPGPEVGQAIRARRLEALTAGEGAQ